MRQLNSREKMLLGVLAVGFVAALYYLRADKLGFGSVDTANDTVYPDGDPPSIRMDLMARAGATFDPDGRNLFDYYTPPKTVVKRQPPPPPPPRKPPPQRDAPPPRPKAVPREPPPPSPNFRYLGFLGPKDDRIAVFEAGSGMVLARAGDVVEEAFQLKEFRYESVVFGFTNKKFADKTTELKMTAH